MFLAHDAKRVCLNLPTKKTANQAILRCDTAGMHVYDLYTCFLTFLLSLLFFSAPCPLSSFLPTLNCTSGVVSLTWNSSEAGVVHMVSAVDRTGHQHNCSGTTGGCKLSTLECGKQYNVSITPVRNGCVGRNSATPVITTGK